MIWNDEVMEDIGGEEKKSEAKISTEMWRYAKYEKLKKLMRSYVFIKMSIE